VLPQFLHVRADEHLAQLDEIAVLLVVDFNHTPRVRATTDGAPIACVDFAVRAYDGEGDLGCDFLIFRDRLFVVISYCGAWKMRIWWCAISERIWREVSMGDVEVGKEAYALLEADNLLVGQGICLGDDGDQVNLGVQAAHNSTSICLSL
jgi:hypothetical protein